MIKRIRQKEKVTMEEECTRLKEDETTPRRTFAAGGSAWTARWRRLLVGARTLGAPRARVAVLGPHLGSAKDATMCAKNVTMSAKDWTKSRNVPRT